MTTADLIAAHATLWQAATRHPFLDGVRDGTLPAAALDRWLVQDYLYVGALLRFQARLLARAPRADQRVLAEGALALVDELAWFEALAHERGLDLAAPIAPANATYIAALERFDSAPYPAAIVALWAIERAYADAWNSVHPGAEPYRAFVEHWTAPGFAEYVAALAAAADRALATATEAERQAAVAAFVEVAERERDFWQMAFAG